jgi:predicted DNA-binding ribbon-helix-helix protein
MAALINRNISIGVGGRRTSVRLEPEAWDALHEICLREQMPIGAVIGQLHAEHGRTGSLTSALRMFILNYFREAATEEGHAAANHGSLTPAEE